jgi:hypothetical protein
VSLPEISTGNDISANWVQCFSLFLANFGNLARKTKTEAAETNGLFFGKIGPKSPHYEETKSKLLLFKE